MTRDSRVHKSPGVGSIQDGPLVGLLVTSFPEPTGPSWLEVGESPTIGDPISLSLETHALVLSKTPHEASVAQDIVEESSAPLEKVGMAQHQAPMMMAASSTTQIVTIGCLAKVAVMERGPFLDGFHVGASLVTLNRAVSAPFHNTRTDLVSTPPAEHLGCHAETSAEDVSLISSGLHAVDSLFTLGKVVTEGDRVLKGLVLSNYVLTPLRVGIEDFGVPDGDEGG